MRMELELGEKVVSGGRTVTVTPLAHETLPAVGQRLIEVAGARETITYGGLRRDLDLRYLVQGMGRLLDLVTEDCLRRGEPSLASLVVNATSGEVGTASYGDPAAERERVHAHWA